MFLQQHPPPPPPPRQSAKQTKDILDQLESLHLKVDQLEKQGSSKFLINITDISSVLNEKNVLELLTTCRCIAIILSFVPCLNIKNDSADEGLFCTVCECVPKYNFECGLSFDYSENLPSSFSYLKESVKRHIQNTTHNTTSALRISSQRSKRYCTNNLKM